MRTNDLRGVPFSISVVSLSTPTGYFPTLRPLISHVRNLDHMPREWSAFLARKSVVVPLEVAEVSILASRHQRVNDRYGVVERETGEVGVGRENPVVTSANIFQNVRGWICFPKMGKGMQERSCGHGRKLFQPLHNHHLVVTDADTANKHIETIDDESRVHACEIGRCREVFGSRQVDGFVQGYLECPRNASKIRWSCLGCGGAHAGQPANKVIGPNREGGQRQDRGSRKMIAINGEPGSLRTRFQRKGMISLPDRQ